MRAKNPRLYSRRKFDALLRDRKRREDRLPLIVKGARQVGKTESIRHFAKAGLPLAYFKRDNSTLEMDFFARSSDNIVPIEVKAENNRAKSLRVLIDSNAYRDIRWGEEKNIV